jgi:hypothetical protein
VTSITNILRGPGGLAVNISTVSVEKLLGLIDKCEEADETDE